MGMENTLGRTERLLMGTLLVLTAVRGRLSYNGLSTVCCREWINGVPVNGVLQCKNGTWYEGAWVDGKVAGNGRLTRTTTDYSYCGDVMNGVAEGHGTRRANNGSTYVGSWKDGLPHGQGRESGGVRGWFYEGEWRNGKWHGKGVWRRSAPGWPTDKVRDSIDSYLGTVPPHLYKCEY